MNKQPENQTTPITGDQKKAKATKPDHTAWLEDELKQQELDKMAGGARPMIGDDHITLLPVKPENIKP
jgi:hypothetical protein